MWPVVPTKPTLRSTTACQHHTSIILLASQLKGFGEGLVLFAKWFGPREEFLRNTGGRYKNPTVSLLKHFDCWRLNFLKGAKPLFLMIATYESIREGSTFQHPHGPHHCTSLKHSQQHKNTSFYGFSTCVLHSRVCLQTKWSPPWRAFSWRSQSELCQVKRK